MSSGRKFIPIFPAPIGRRLAIGDADATTSVQGQEGRTLHDLWTDETRRSRIALSESMMIGSRLFFCVVSFAALAIVLAFESFVTAIVGRKIFVRFDVPALLALRVGLGNESSIRMVQDRMRAQRHHFEIGRIIVRFVVVLVMYDFPRFKRTTKNVFHHATMLQHLFAIAVGFPVALFIFVSRATHEFREKWIAGFIPALPVLDAPAASAYFFTTIGD